MRTPCSLCRSFQPSPSSKTNQSCCSHFAPEPPRFRLSSRFVSQLNIFCYLSLALCYDKPCTIGRNAVVEFLNFDTTEGFLNYGPRTTNFVLTNFPLPSKEISQSASHSSYISLSSHVFLPRIIFPHSPFSLHMDLDSILHILLLILRTGFSIRCLFKRVLVN